MNRYSLSIAALLLTTLVASPASITQASDARDTSGKCVVSFVGFTTEGMANVQYDGVGRNNKPAKNHMVMNTPGDAQKSSALLGCDYIDLTNAPSI